MTPEEYYKEEFAEDYKLVKDIKETKLFSFKSVMQFAEMYHTKQLIVKPSSLQLKEKEAPTFEEWTKTSYYKDKYGDYIHNLSTQKVRKETVLKRYKEEFNL